MQHRKHDPKTQQEKPVPAQSATVPEDDWGDVISFNAGSVLPEIPARPGMQQRWVTYRLQGQDSPQNLMKRVQKQRWRPRKPDEMTEDFLRTQHSVLGDVIATHDAILMERPVRFGESEQAHVDELTEHQSAAVRERVKSFQRDNRNDGYQFTDRESVDRETISTGRQVEIPD